jgi:hypothetical protein
VGEVEGRKGGGRERGSKRILKTNIHEHMLLQPLIIDTKALIELTSLTGEISA